MKLTQVQQAKVNSLKIFRKQLMTKLVSKEIKSKEYNDQFDAEVQKASKAIGIAETELKFMVVCE